MQKILYAVLAPIARAFGYQAVTQHTTVDIAGIQASFLSPERTASSQKKALARAHETAPRNQ